MYKAPRGTSDILPDEQVYWKYVEDKAVTLCRLYGYERLDTPVFEDLQLFVRSIGEGTDIVTKEMYTFKDRGGKKLTLRPEGTAPVCRAYLEHGLYNLPQPVRLYYIATIFRYERPQAGRYRQHYQFGFEAIGASDPVLDAEVIDMARQFYSSLGLAQLSFKLNSIGCRICRPEYVKSLKEYYSSQVTSLCPDCRARLRRNPLRLLDCKKPSCLVVAQAAPKSTDCLCPECQSHFEDVKKYLINLGLSFELDHKLVRGLDYYTRTVFEVQPKGETGAQTALGGGGRYDDLIEELGGKPTAAVGFAAGLERIIGNLAKQGISVPALPKPKVFITYVGDEPKSEAVKIASNLRKVGIPVIVAAGDRSLKAQLRQANALGCHHTIIIGSDELRTGSVTLRNMVSGEQESVPVADLATALHKDKSP